MDSATEAQVTVGIATEASTVQSSVEVDEVVVTTVSVQPTDPPHQDTTAQIDEMVEAIQDAMVSQVMRVQTLERMTREWYGAPGTNPPTRPFHRNCIPKDEELEARIQNMCKRMDDQDSALQKTQQLLERVACRFPVQLDDSCTVHDVLQSIKYLHSPFGIMLTLFRLWHRVSPTTYPLCKAKGFHNWMLVLVPDRVLLKTSTLPLFREISSQHETSKQSSSSLPLLISTAVDHLATLWKSSFERPSAYTEFLEHQIMEGQTDADLVARCMLAEQQRSLDSAAPAVYKPQIRCANGCIFTLEDARVQSQIDHILQTKRSSTTVTIAAASATARSTTETFLEATPVKD